MRTLAIVKSDQLTAIGRGGSEPDRITQGRWRRKGATGADQMRALVELIRLVWPAEPVGGQRRADGRPVIAGTAVVIGVARKCIMCDDPVFDG